ncbi:MAG: hypothetical protein MI865_08300, partial [Proteobacteria bacterium]|nr:hypothetical protein [Pseudomonadota bacterium]
MKYNTTILFFVLWHLSTAQDQEQRRIEIIPAYQLLDGSARILDEGICILYRLNENFDTMSVEVMDGTITFDGLESDFYLTYVIPDRNFLGIHDLGSAGTDSVELFPTFYKDAAQFNDADTIELNNFFTDTVWLRRKPPAISEVVVTVESNSAMGIQRIPGFDCQFWIFEEYTDAGGRRSNDGRFIPIDHGVTDSSGIINFRAYEFGLYAVFVHFPG